jgi:hypothetical protein
MRFRRPTLGVDVGSATRNLQPFLCDFQKIRCAFGSCHQNLIEFLKFGQCVEAFPRLVSGVLKVFCTGVQQGQQFGADRIIYPGRIFWFEPMQPNSGWKLR